MRFGNMTRKNKLTFYKNMTRNNKMIFYKNVPIEHINHVIRWIKEDNPDENDRDIVIGILFDNEGRKIFLEDKENSFWHFIDVES